MKHALQKRVQQFPDSSRLISRCQSYLLPLCRRVFLDAYGMAYGLDESFEAKAKGNSEMVYLFEYC